VVAAHETIQLAELAPTVAGKADPSRIDQITLEELGRRNRLQTVVLKALVYIGLAEAGASPATTLKRGSSSGSSAPTGSPSSRASSPRTRCGGVSS